MPTPTVNSPHLRNAPVQPRSRERLRRVLDAAEEVLVRDGADAFTTTRVASQAGVPIGSVYRFYPDKEAIAEALAMRYWSDLEDLVSGIAAADEAEALQDPVGDVVEALVAGFRARPGFLVLWYGGLRTERVRDATRPTRTAIARSVERILARHWPRAGRRRRSKAADMVVLAGDGLLREAFRRDRRGDRHVLAETKLMLRAYLEERLG
jgi:AcrR family transcriptional regulator